jgi:ribonuclease E
MSKEICISTTPHETRLAILENDELTEIYYERENEYTLAGSIYKGKVTRVLPGMQSAFVDLGLERDAFLYVTDFLEEQEDGADFDRIGSATQQPRREGGKEGGRDSNREGSRENGRDGSRENGSREGGREGGRGRQPLEVVSAEPAPTADKEDSEDGDSPSGTRRWRGRRGRRRGFRPRGQETATAELESPEAIEEAIVDEPVTLPEHGAPGGTQASNRILLPGESLSKYGGKPTPSAGITIEAVATLPETEPVFKPNYIAPKPSTLIETPIEWDGGGLLPGESRAKRQKTVAAPVVSESTISEPFAGEPVAAAVEEAAAPQEAPVTEAEREEIRSEADQILAEAFHTLPTTDFEVAAEDADRTALVEPTLAEPKVPELELAEPEVAVVPEVAGTHAEVISEPPPLVHDEPEAIVAEQVHEVEAAPVAEAAAEVHEPEVHHHELVEEVHEFEPESGSASFRIDPAGPSEFRLSSIEEAEPVFVEETVAEQVVEHEASVPEVEQHFEHTVEPSVEDENEPHDAQATEVADQLFGFAPGAGILEEEVIDEDEYDFEPIHAHADEHDVEDLEEETLDQSGAEIGDTVREMHMEHRLSVEPGLDVEEDEDSDELEYGETDEEGEEDEEEDEPEGAEQEQRGEPAAASSNERSGGRDGERRPRRGDRDRGHERGGRDRGGRGGQQGRRRHGGGGRRPSAQVTDLPIISELLKQGQEILVQIAKEPIAKKGARITSHIALPGRFLVFMPTVNHVGVSRKISSDDERQRLKRILISEKGDASGGFIVRTAADGASEEELRADLRFLISLWNDIKQREESSKAPALIYHDLNLVERVLRDQVSDNFSTIWVDSEAEYERIVRFLNRFQPSLVRRVKLYTKETPLFEQFGIQDEISKALKSKVWLKSGGSIVINQTEALVAIDINTGKYVGKTARLEDTILKTNLDAIPEIVRQIRLRDLGGIIVIDFIDMDERKNRHKVMAALEEALKADRAPSKVLQFNDFGLVAITRKRVKQSLERTLSIPCPVCTATGMVKSPVTVANEIYVELRKMQRHLDRGDVMLRVNPEVVKTLKANNAKWLNEMEEMLGKTIIVKSDPALHPEQFDIH